MKKNNLSILILTIACLFFYSCSNNENEEEVLTCTEDNYKIPIDRLLSKLTTIHPGYLPTIRNYEYTYEKKPKEYNGKVNTKFHDGPVAFSKDGQNIYITRNNYFEKNRGKDDEGVTRLKIFIGDKKGKEWKNLTGLPFNSDEYSVAHPTITDDKKRLYFSSDMPTECISSSSIGPDNDADGVSDLCDSDDDNDTISDLNELHWGMDVFTAFDFDLEQETDHDKDGLMSSDEIGYGYSPFIINKPPIVKLDGFFLNHKNSVQTPNSESILVYQYASINNQTFSFGSRHPNYHYELNEELLLTGTSVVDEGPIDFKHEFQPAIRIFPSPVLVSHEYKRSISVTAIETDNITGKTVSIPALVTVISKVVLSDDGKNLGFNYLLHISNKNTSDLIIRKLNEPTIWNVTKGIIGLGELDNYTSLVEYIPPGTKPETVNPQSSESSSSNKSGGAFHFIFLLTLFAILKVVRLDKPYLYVKRTRN